VPRVSRNGVVTLEGDGLARFVVDIGKREHCLGDLKEVIDD
jgi:hypothetical protein